MTEDSKENQAAFADGDVVTRAFIGHADIRDLLSRVRSLASPIGSEPFSIETILADPSIGSREKRWTLEKLADPRHFTEPVQIDGWSADALESFLRRMLLIRSVEERLATIANRGGISGPLHLSIGQEAIAVGVSHHLTKHDRVFGGHRSIGHYLALGGDVVGILAAAIGLRDGSSTGRRGLIHLFAPEIGFLGASPIVGATIPIAAGAALAAAMEDSDDVAVAYFGDGATEQGILHETLNFAVSRRLPLLFVCENNLYADHLDIAFRQPADCTARFADAHGVPASVVDGNDVVAVADAARTLIARARRGEGPGYLEAVTYRWRSHAGADERPDGRLQRSVKELSAWKRRDPIRRLEDAVVSRGDISPDQLADLIEGIYERVDRIAHLTELSASLDTTTLQECLGSAGDA